MTKPNKDGPKSDGRFKPGNRLGGSKTGSRHRTTLAIEALLEGQHAALTQVAIQRALAGDSVALRLCLDRLAPPRRDAPIEMELPPVTSASDAVEASSAILAVVAAGDITPDEGARLMALLTAHRGMIESADLDRRLAALEALQQLP